MFLNFTLCVLPILNYTRELINNHLNLDTGLKTMLKPVDLRRVKYIFIVSNLIGIFIICCRSSASIHYYAGVVTNLLGTCKENYIIRDMYKENRLDSR